MFDQFSKDDLIEWLRANGYADSSDVSMVTREECDNLLHLFFIDPEKDADFFKRVHQRLGARKLFVQNVITARKDFFVPPSNYWYIAFLLSFYLSIFLSFLLYSSSTPPLLLSLLLSTCFLSALLFLPLLS
jgi:hypothetical protein